jgi:hypothetical protein
VQLQPPVLNGAPGGVPLGQLHVPTAVVPVYVVVGFEAELKLQEQLMYSSGHAALHSGSELWVVNVQEDGPHVLLA